MHTHDPRRSRWLSYKTISLLVVAILIGGVTALVTFANRTPTIVRTGSSTAYTNQDGLFHLDQYELFPSPSGAATMFEQMLNESKDYREYSPCFDDRGKRVGEKAAMWLFSPTPSKAFWRIVWTQRKEASSELFYVEADTLEGAHAMEVRVREKWRLCRTKN